MTNRQWLESLTDEELALRYLHCNFYKPNCDKAFSGDDCGETCVDCKVEWLNAEHKEEE